MEPSGNAEQLLPCLCIVDAQCDLRVRSRQRFAQLNAADARMCAPAEDGSFGTGGIVLDIPMSYKGKTTVVRVELQLRTMIMDAWAGMDNRVSYKKGVPPEMERRIEKYARIGRRLDKLIQKTLDDSKTV